MGSPGEALRMPFRDSDTESGDGEDANTTQEEGPEHNLSLGPDEVTATMNLNKNTGLKTDQQFPALLVIPANYIETLFPVQWPYSSIMKVKLYQAPLSYVFHFKRPLHMTYLVLDPLPGITTADTNVTTGEFEACDDDDVATANAACVNEEDTTEKCYSEDVTIDVANEESNASAEYCGQVVHSAYSSESPSTCNSEECEKVDVEDAVIPKCDCGEENTIQNPDLEDKGMRTNIHEAREELNGKVKADDSDESHATAPALEEVPEDGFDTVDHDFDSPLSTLSFPASNHSSPSREQDFISDERPLRSHIIKPKHIQYDTPCVSDRNEENLSKFNAERTSRMMLFTHPSTIPLDGVGDGDLILDTEGIVVKSGENENCEAGDMDPPMQAMGSDEPIKVAIRQNTIEEVSVEYDIGNGNLPDELQEDYWDASLICLDKDEKNAKEFAREFAREFEDRCRGKSKRPISFRFSCELLCQDLFEQLNVLLERGSCILLYMTHDFIKDRLAKYKTHTALYESLANKGRCGSLIPIFYETPRKDLDIPTELRVLTGTSWEKETHRENLVRTCLEKTAVTDENMKDLEDKREVARAEICLRHDEQKKKKQDQLIRIKLERKTFFNCE